ncbi:hypothetical protein HK103_004333 [Boothiomyces macroporosus]|uniref:Cytochrome b5 heme-binding domain-containing protein n=1 Tax=Boothiomyces macroporosus TaxID=261099 RepID=A0AAD5Y3I0_9FUNG|nr:hypothetical protein HK103_004333 [Boothiomyces macroporosus]
MGEGHHNYHHEFPCDYRNGIRWFHWDPTKWLINLNWCLGQAYGLVSIEDQVVQKARISVWEEELEKKKRQLIWTDESKLPEWTMKQFQKEAKYNDLILIDEFVLDVSKFKDQHPGGKELLEKYFDSDATKSFYGVLNNHTRSAKQIAKDLRIAKLK